MEKYIRKRLIIEATRWDGTEETYRQIVEWMDKKIPRSSMGDNSEVKSVLHIDSQGRKMEVNEGDFIMKGVDGDYYSCTCEYFEKNFEKVIRTSNNHGVGIW